LNAERQSLDETSEEMGRKLISGDVDIASFLKVLSAQLFQFMYCVFILYLWVNGEQDYMEARTKYHVLSTKVQLARIV